MGILIIPLQHILDIIMDGDNIKDLVLLGGIKLKELFAVCMLVEVAACVFVSPVVLVLLSIHGLAYVGLNTLVGNL